MSQTAIEYGAARLRLLEFEGGGRKLRVLNVRDVDLTVVGVEAGEEGEDEIADVQAERIDEVMREEGFRADPSVMSFDSAHAIFREFDLPFTNEEQIRKVVRFESESHLPLDIDDVVVQHVVLRKTRDKSHILVAAVKKDELLDRLDILDAAGIDPMQIDMDVFALYHALVGTGVTEEHERFAVVHASERSTSLLFIEAGGLYAVRSIRIGTHAVTHGHDVDDHAGDSGIDQDIETARTHDYLARLKREIRRTLTTLPDAGEFDTIYITGSGSRLPAFPEAIDEVFGGEVQELDLLSRVDHRLDDEDARHFGPDVGVALGMAFKFNGLDETETEFRREEAAYKRKFDQVVASLIVASFLVLLLTAFMALDAFLDVRLLRTEYAHMRDLATLQLSKMRGDTEAEQRLAEVEVGPRQMDRAVRLAEAYKETIARDLGRSAEIPDQQSALNAWFELFNALRDNQVALGKFFMSRLDINVGNYPTIKMDGELADFDRYQALLDVLKDVGMFMTVKPGGTRQYPTYVKFTDLTIELDASLLTKSRGGQP